jgi:hypothetical protein
MDHLWLDRNSQQRPDAVPYLEPGRLKYFPNPPEAWYQDTLSSMNGHDQSVGDIVLQKWLFFGVLNQYFALFAIDCRREDFIADRDGQRVLSTAKLHLLAQRVLGRRAARYGPENEDLVQSILEDLLRPSGTDVESSDVPASAQLEQEPEETQRALIVAV